MFSKCIPFWNMAIFNFGRVNMTGGRSLQPSPMLVFHWRRIWSSTTFASPMATWRRSFDKFQEGKGKILLSQWHTFDTYLVGNLGNTKLKVLYRDAFGWVSNIYIQHTHIWYIYIPISYLLKQLNLQWSFSGSGKGLKGVSITTS